MLLARIRAGRDRFSRLLGAQAQGRVGVGYALKVVAAALASFFVCAALHLANPIWAVVSSIVVILPESRASVTAAALRAIANLVGASTGIALAVTGLPQLVAVAVGLAVVAGLCRLLALDAAARTASVALVIVTLRSPGSVLGSSELRVVQVLLGCAVALGVTVCAAAIERVVRPTA